MQSIHSQFYSLLQIYESKTKERKRRDHRVIFLMKNNRNMKVYSKKAIERLLYGTYNPSTFLKEF